MRRFIRLVVKEDLKNANEAIQKDRGWQQATLDTYRERYGSSLSTTQAKHVVDRVFQWLDQKGGGSVAWGYFGDFETDEAYNDFMDAVANGAPEDFVSLPSSRGSEVLVRIGEIVRVRTEPFEQKNAS